MTEKRCRTCRETKPVEQFSRNRTTRDGRQDQCKACNAKRFAKYYAANNEKVNARGREYREATPERQTARRRGRSESDKVGRSRRLDALLAEQGNVCAICKRTAEKWHVDHDHACCPGKPRKTCGNCIRGILCPSCNTGLGRFGDNAEGVRKALAYLERWESSNAN